MSGLDNFSKINLGTAMMNSAEVSKYAKDFVAFLNRAVTPFHVEECSKLLRSAGFRELKESEKWNLEPKSKYFVTRNQSTIYAFAVGAKFTPGNGFSIVVGHTDSPNLRVKPCSKLSACGIQQVGVSTYGGGLWRTWFDRDLSVAGRVILNQNGKLSERLVKIDRPILHIPNLAIHLTDRTQNFNPNTEDHLKPLLATVVKDALNSSEKTGSCGEPATDGEKKEAVVKASDCRPDHHSEFLELIAEAAECKPPEIIDMDLCLYDTQPAAITGLKSEFISGGRLDNLVGTYTAIRALIESVSNEAALDDETNIRLAICFDNEECGSGSAQGAGTSLTEWVLRRLSNGTHPTAFEEAIPKSYLISGDQAHACHPNYRAKHEENHQPTFHGGVTVKMNVNQRYATTGITGAILKTLADRAQVPLQKFVVRNDSPCGSTVGPILAANLGLQTIDVGTPQLAMHSVRELAGTSCIWQSVKLFTEFYNAFPEVLKNSTF